MHFPPKIWEENGSASYSLKVAYPAGDSGAAVEWVFFSHFPPLKPRYVLWSGASHSLKNMAIKDKSSGEVILRNHLIESSEHCSHKVVSG